MFERLPSGQTRPLSFSFEGAALKGQEGDSVATALLANGITDFRATVPSGAARGPFCLMGACFDCLVEIDGRPNRQACLLKLRDGMRIRRQERGRQLAP